MSVIEMLSPASPAVPRLWVSITTYARIHGVSRPTVYKWLDADLLEYFREGGVVRIKNLPPSVKARQS